MGRYHFLNSIIAYFLTKKEEEKKEKERKTISLNLKPSTCLLAGNIDDLIPTNNDAPLILWSYQRRS